MKVVGGSWRKLRFLLWEAFGLLAALLGHSLGLSLPVQNPPKLFPIRKNIGISLWGSSEISSLGFL